MVVDLLIIMVVMLVTVWLNRIQVCLHCCPHHQLVHLLSPVNGIANLVIKLKNAYYSLRLFLIPIQPSLLHHPIHHLFVTPIGILTMVQHMSLTMLVIF